MNVTFRLYNHWDTDKERINDRVGRINGVQLLPTEYLRYLKQPKVSQHKQPAMPSLEHTFDCFVIEMRTHSMHSQTEMEVERVCGLIIEQDRKK